MILKLVLAFLAGVALDQALFEVRHYFWQRRVRREMLSRDGAAEEMIGRLKRDLQEGKR